MRQTGDFSTGQEDQPKAATDVSPFFAAGSKVQEAAQVLLKEFSCTLSARGGSIYLVEEGQLVLQDTLDPGHAPTSMPLPLPPGSSIGRAFVEKAPVHAEDISGEESLTPSGWNGYKDGSFVVFPLIANDGAPLGSISLHDKKNPPFTAKDRQIGSILAAHGCDALKAARMADALEIGEPQYRELVENMDEALYSLDTSGRVLYVNTAIEGILGYKPGEVTGHFFQEFFPGAERLRVGMNFAKVLAGESVVAEYHIFSKPGKLHWVLASAHPGFENDRVVRIQGVVTDITSQKQAKT